jgi:cobalt-zinc-cadmium efflux system protein
MGHDHSHAVKVEGNEKRLWGALGLTAAFMVAEVVGGILTNSLALLSDAAHMFTDVTALAISLAAVKIGKRAVDERRTYGYERFEILAAAFNALLLFGVAAYILFEAWQRFRTPASVESGLMLWIAAAGFVVNLIAMRLLSAGKEESLNVKGAYLEVWSDLLGSAGVIAAALVIRFTGWTWVDPVVAVGIGLWVLPRTWSLLKESTHILLEGTPAHVDLPKLRSRLGAHAGVKEVHDLHVWALTSSRHVLTAHVVVDGTQSPDLLKSLCASVRDEFDIFHTTIQIEDEACGDLHAPMHGDEGRDHDHDPGHDHDHDHGHRHERGR